MPLQPCSVMYIESESDALNLLVSNVSIMSQLIIKHNSQLLAMSPSITQCYQVVKGEGRHVIPRR